MENKVKYKLVASDLDGTLLGDDQRVSAVNLEAISKMAKCGVRFVPATGRCIGEMPEDVKNCPDVKYIITSDGSVVWDNEREEVVVSKYIPHDVVETIIREMRKYSVYPLAHEDGKPFYDLNDHNPENLDACRVNDYFRDLIKRTNIPLTDFDEYFLASDKVELFCIFFEHDSDYHAFEDAMRKTGRLSVAQSAPHSVEICAIEAGKGNTLIALAEKLGIPAEEVIAVGDSRNDISLVTAAGLGLAMENASDELKAVADKIICHYSENSAKYILDNFLMTDEK